MKLISITPFLAITILGIAVFTTHPTLGQKTDFAQWKNNQQILLLIENCQEGQLSSDICKSKISVVLNDCKLTHVLACDDKRLLDLLYREQMKISTN